MRLRKPTYVCTEELSRFCGVDVKGGGTVGEATHAIQTDTPHTAQLSEQPKRDEQRSQESAPEKHATNRQQTTDDKS
ncbi:hypothetical protein BC567DRAFT_223792 [Phyllosticta citribraziliensis]